ncbi:MAG TPA: methyltransferase [Steroidobacteraceae bacterium]|jgi:hypothetical protein
MLDHPQEFQSWLHDITAYQAVIHAIATTQLLDQWGSEPISLKELSARTKIDAAQLGRLINVLASQGVLEILPDGSIGHTPRSRSLQSFRAATMVQKMALQSGLRLGEAVQTGKTAFESYFGKPVFEYFAENPEQARFFGERMSQITLQDEPLILGQLRFPPFRLAVDIGGGHGTLLSGLLAQYPQAHGIVFDMPDVAERAAQRLRVLPEGSRIESVGGDFFKSVPTGGDLYLLKQILHDWCDADCITILKSVRQAIARGGRIAVIERLLPEAIAPDPVFAFDILMMIWTTGQERKLHQIQGLLESAGFAIGTVTQNPGRMSIVEATPI